MKRDYGTYHVGLKILLRKGDDVLFLRTDDGKHWDLPGGRIDNIESKTPLTKILAREVCEELGPSLRYRLGKPIMHFRRYITLRKIYGFLAVFEADYISGEIALSFEHDSFKWINPRTFAFKRKDFFNQEEWQAFKKYFKER